MTPLVPLALFGWPLVTVIAFLRLPPQRAVLVSVIGGVLFLPMESYNWPGIPVYNKTTAIAVGLLLGERISGSAYRFRLRLRWFDVPAIVWCFLVPLASALSNNLGWYDGVSGTVRHYLTFGVLYWTGRRYFADPSSLLLLARGIVIGGLLYVPLVLFEARMSPQLSNMVYGFFPHSWIQHIRYGGWRPIVFMQHGLMVAFWMAVCTMVAYWLCRNHRTTRIKGIPMFLAVLALGIATVLSRSANGVILLVIGLAAHAYFRNARSVRLFQLLLLFAPLYMWFRMTDVISVEQVGTWVGVLFDDERVGSLLIRMRQEELFGARALQRPWFGWYGYRRGWPVDYYTGRELIAMIDARWIIELSNRGIVGLVSYFVSLGLGPWLIFKNLARRTLGSWAVSARAPTVPVVLSLVVVSFIIDSLVNDMQGTIYIMTAGALVTASLGNNPTDCSGPSKSSARTELPIGSE